MRVRFFLPADASFASVSVETDEARRRSACPHTPADEARTASATRTARSHVPPLRDTHRGGAMEGDPATARHADLVDGGHPPCPAFRWCPGAAEAVAARCGAD